MTTRIDQLDADRAEALFTSCLSGTGDRTTADVEGAIEQALRVYGGVRGCAGEVAARFGDSPDTAARRMRWARSVVADTFAPRPPAERPARSAGTVTTGAGGAR